MKHSIYHVIIILAALVTSCDSLDVKGMFFSSGSHTEDRVADWLAWNDQHGPNIIENAPDNYRVFFCSDPHLNNDFSRLDTYLHKVYTDPMSLFCVVNGDIANEAGERPYRVLDSLTHCARPYNHIPTPGEDTCFAVIGNHDIYFDCQQYYQQYFHTSTYSVEVRTLNGNKDLFVFLDSGNATFGKRQTEWLKELLQRNKEYRHIVVTTHTSLFRTTYNYSTTPAANMPQDEAYALFDLLDRNNVDLFVMGHFHYREEHQIGNVRYVMTNNLNDTEETPTYLVVSCGDNIDYKYEYLTGDFHISD